MFLINHLKILRLGYYFKIIGFKISKLLFCDPQLFYFCKEPRMNFIMNVGVIVVFALVQSGICVEKPQLEFFAAIEPLDVIETAEKLLVQLDAVVTNTQGDAFSILSPLSDELGSSGEAVRDHYRRVYQEQVASASRSQHNLISEAEELGNIDMDKLNQCLFEQRNTLSDLSTRVTNQMHSCILSAVDLGRSLINSTIETVKTTTNIVERLELKVDQCKLLPNQQDECVIPLLEQIGLAIVELPTRIIDDTDKCIIVTDVLEKTLDACGGDRLQEIPKVNQDILKILRVCAGMPTA